MSRFARRAYKDAKPYRRRAASFLFLLHERNADTVFDALILPSLFVILRRAFISFVMFFSLRASTAFFDAPPSHGHYRLLSIFFIFFFFSRLVLPVSCFHMIFYIYFHLHFFIDYHIFIDFSYISRRCASRFLFFFHLLRFIFFAAFDAYARCLFCRARHALCAYYFFRHFDAAYAALADAYASSFFRLFRASSFARCRHARRQICRRHAVPR